MAERAADFRLAPGSEPDRQDRLPPPVLVGLVSVPQVGLCRLTIVELGIRFFWRKPVEH